MGYSHSSKSTGKSGMTILTAKHGSPTQSTKSANIFCIPSNYPSLPQAVINTPSAEQTPRWKESVNNDQMNEEAEGGRKCHADHFRPVPFFLVFTKFWRRLADWAF